MENHGKEEIAKFYKKYLSEFDAFIERNSGEADYEGWFFTSNNKGEFGVSEGKLGFLNTNFSRNSKIENLQNDIIADFGFTAYCQGKKFQIKNTAESKFSAVFAFVNSFKIVLHQHYYIFFLLLKKLTIVPITVIAKKTYEKAKSEAKATFYYISCLLIEIQKGFLQLQNNSSPLLQTAFFDFL